LRSIPKPPASRAGQVRAPHTLNPAQQAAYDAIRLAIDAREFRAFLLYGVTGSGKTEVYLNAIEAAWRKGRGALLLVPEIALTPAMAGQFFSRFGDRVAILHSAFTDVERSDQWRRIRSGAASVVVARAPACSRRSAIWA
jgi:primosomal protein N' (replication factor Y) (superfamily II helicase)